MKKKFPSPAFERLYKDFTNSENTTWLNDSLGTKQTICQADQITFCFSRQPLCSELFSKLLALADQHNLKEFISSLSTADFFKSQGHPLSSHVRLRATENCNGALWQHFFQWASALATSRSLADPDMDVRHVIHLGTGGSLHGPELLADALAPANPPYALHFLSGTQPVAIARVLSRCDPRHTLVIAASKSFTTAETIDNLTTLKQWLLEALGSEQAGKQVLAITSDTKAAYANGIALQNCLQIPATLSGRFSICSPVSLAAAAWIGVDCFRAFVDGAQRVDQHFRRESWASNAPVISALLSIWGINFLGIQSNAIIPYGERVLKLIPYLQQVSMESLGKTHTPEGDSLGFSTGPIVWGGVGPESQHSFHQLLMQGSHRIGLEFIVPFENDGAESSSLLHNALAQMQLLQRGELPGCDEPLVGGHPSQLLLFPRMSARFLGNLIAFYEHKTAVQSLLWGINCFDQPGVEAGKQLSRKIQANATNSQLDKTTQELLSFLAHPEHMTTI